MSINKTQLGLNKWTSGEKPLMSEFNSDNQIIDKKLLELSQEVANKANNNQLNNYVTQPQFISENEDLDDYKTAGFYYCNADVTANTIKNKPLPGSFSLLVETHAGYKQTYTRYHNNTSPDTYIRNFYRTWGDWYKVVMEKV